MKILAVLFLLPGNCFLFLGALAQGLIPLAPNWPWLVFCLYPGLALVYYTSGSFTDNVDSVIRYHLAIGAVSSLVLVFTVLLSLLGLPTWISAVAIGCLVLSVLEYLASCLYFQENRTDRVRQS